MPPQDPFIRSLVCTDGSVHCEEKRGGWAMHVRLPDNSTKVISGQQASEDSNRMELLAILTAVQEVSGPLSIVTDSLNIVNPLQTMVDARNRGGHVPEHMYRDLPNTDLWAQFAAELNAHEELMYKVHYLKNKKPREEEKALLATAREDHKRAHNAAFSASHTR